jgi:hypothetical protein
MLRHLALITVISITACSCMRAPLSKGSTEITDRYAIVRLANEQGVFVLAKGTSDLKLALEQMGCSKGQACSVQSLGSFYAVQQWNLEPTNVAPK